MPIYEYRCTECGHELEELQGINDRPLRKCPECKGKLERLQSAPAFQFKGTGWYVTDYAKSSGGSSKSGDTSSDKSGASDSKAESKSSSKGDSKSADSKGASSSKK